MFLPNIVDPMDFDVDIDLACQWIQQGYLDINQYSNYNQRGSKAAVVRLTVDKRIYNTQVEGSRFPLYCYVIVSCQPAVINEFIVRLKTLKLSQLGSLSYQEDLRSRLADIPLSEFAEDKLEFTSEDLSHLVSCGCRDRCQH